MQAAEQHICQLHVQWLELRKASPVCHFTRVLWSSIVISSELQVNDYQNEISCLIVQPLPELWWLLTIASAAPTILSAYDYRTWCGWHRCSRITELVASVIVAMMFNSFHFRKLQLYFIFWHIWSVACSITMAAHHSKCGSHNPLCQQL